MDRTRRLFLAQLVAVTACQPERPAIEPAKTTTKPVEPPANPHRVTGYKLDLDLDVPGRKFTGALVVSVKLGADSELVLHATELEIASVKAQGRSLAYEVSKGVLRIDRTALGTVGVSGGSAAIEIAYRGAASKGLRMNDECVFTAFDTPRWMPCDFAPATRTTFDVSVNRPPGWFGVGNGPEQSTGDRIRWTSSDRFPAYTLGFAIGDLRLASARVADVDVMLLSTYRTPVDIAGVFAPIGEMITFLRAKSGVAYPGKTFSVVLAPGSVAQEYARFAVVSEDYAYEWLAEPREDWLFCHELAHSWWGNLMTCASWSHFWLNEAFATFMTAAFKESRWGRPEYDRERALARRRVDKMIRAGKARPLELPPNATVEDAGGPWSYAYGMEVLHATRTKMGDAAFFQSVRKLVVDHQQGSVTTDDFLEAFAPAQDAWRAELTRMVRETPKAAPASERGLAELLSVAQSAPDDVERYTAIEALADHCKDGCESTAAGLAVLTSDPNRAIAMAARRIRRAARRAFWRVPRRGANLFEKLETADRLKAVSGAGFDFVRIAPNKYKSKLADFLIGDVAAFAKLVPEDANELVRVLDDAQKANLKVVLTMWSLPGARRPPSYAAPDVPLWGDDELQARAALFWQELIRRVGSHEALAGYDLFHEPRPEASAKGAVKDRPGDLNRFYRRLVAAVRAVDPATPIVVESARSASPAAFESLEPIDDDAVLYSFHLLERSTKRLDKAKSPNALEPVTAWMTKHKVGPDRVIAGEVGCIRKNPDAAAHVEDLVALLEERKMHWAYCSLRDDGSDGLAEDLGLGGKARADDGAWRAISSRLRAPRKT